MSKDQRPNSRADIRIATHDVAVQLLAKLDGEAYEKALEQDAKSVNENYLLPLSFPWRQGARLPKKALKAMPRDIDELHVVSRQTIDTTGLSLHKSDPDYHFILILILSDNSL